MRLPFRSETSYKMEMFAGILVLVSGFILLEWFFNLDYLVGLLFHKPEYYEIVLFEICVALLLIGCLIAFIVIPRHRSIKAREKTGSLYLMTYGKKIKVDLAQCTVDEVYQTEVPLYSLVYQNYKSEPLSITKEELSEKISRQKQTFVYVDKRDPSKYCFDVDFLI